MKKILECIPNFSEGRREEVINEIVNAIKMFDVKVLDVEADKDHNRCVVTFIGEPENVKKAAFKAVEKAAELIDMEKHKGEHPRIGATDVLPFVPIRNMKIEEAVDIAVNLGKEIGEKLGIPVYLYESAAMRTERKDLGVIRKGEYEGLKKDISLPERIPDFGPKRMHPTAGAIAVGARAPLVAFNVNLGTNNIEIAKKIARAMRAKNGGFTYVKALGFEIKERGIVQVSMNLTNYSATPIYRVFEAIKTEAKRYGVNIIGSEIVGLVPMDALIDCADFYLQLEKFKKEQILEWHLQEVI
ncbi:MAG: glutamate formimidoyltransferase [Candidatus Thermoplasmatota archaeon]